MSIPVIIHGAAGRMGQTLVNLALHDPGLALAGVVDRHTDSEKLTALDCPVAGEVGELSPPSGAVVVDFSAPEATMHLAESLAGTGLAAVVGTTGLSDEQSARLRTIARDVPIFWAPNMSVGVNVLLQVLPDLVRKLGEDYDLEITEIHHNKKADAPSGTAIKLADCLARARGWTVSEQGAFCRQGIIGPRPKKELGVMTVRGGDVVGDHTVYFLGPGERIEITHRAHSRETFAQGALRAAKWLSGKQPGQLYSMPDMF
ncbi:4-hydroxy-tetrahydrodipicolinate reductase [Desulfohalovibrio reitneri]|jgi:4-hydroxy-tetrahydrodipicolinate reductase|uniref:4-hydroxy-tetrahydrodipicolinate reductase n=1 Tax=Desulfohalovibrio reitneri TaxID=1307759 RepID=UPI0004A7664B|nr:4-hydroxy-tetrahydrodipicolinate reductase [Desulfohalovibrio reitneri]